MREIWLALLTILSLSAAAPALAQTPPAAPPAASAVAPADPLALTPDDRILGKADAPITIIEYGSLTCPHCADFAAEVLPKLTAEWIDTGKAKLAFRPFPRDDADLHASAIAACAAPDRFYPFIDALFQGQQQWAVAANYKAGLGRLALIGGMNKEKFDACFDNKSVQDALLASRLVASQQLNVNATPTFFINGKRFDGAPTIEAFDQALSRLAPPVAAAPPQPAPSQVAQAPQPAPPAPVPPPPAPPTPAAPVSAPKEAFPVLYVILGVVVLVIVVVVGWVFSRRRSPS